jgi:hypothetical protein
MKTYPAFLKISTVIFFSLFYSTLLSAQTVTKNVISITQMTELPIKVVPSIGNNGYKASESAYPLQVSVVDTLFFNRSTDRDFVKNGLVSAGVTSITKVSMMQPLYSLYGGRLYNYYYFCNGVDNGYFVVNGLTTKVNTTFTSSYNASINLYMVLRNYNGNAYSEAVSNYQALANSLAADFGGFAGTEYYPESLINVGYFYFFLNRPGTLITPSITAGGPVTFNAGGSVTLTSSAASGNTWYNNGVAIPGATGASYTATTAGNYTIKTTAAGFNTSFSNTIQVIVNPVVTNAPLTVSGSKLLNHSGVAVLLHGVNAASYHSGYANDVQTVAGSIKNNSNANCVRLMWNSAKFETANNQGNPNPPTYFTLPYLNTELQTYTNLHILPIITLRDLTDIFDNSVAGFNKYVVPFWTDPNLVSILKTYQNNLVINLANEWGATWDGMTASTFISTYKSLIVSLRNAGINCPIMIDAPDGGANSSFIISNGAAIIAADPIHNILLSVHTYWSQENGAIVNCPADYVSYIKAIAASKLPIVLGEVSDWAVRGADGADLPSTPPVNFVCPGSSSANKYAINYDAILTEACADGISFIAWTWYQDGNMVRNIYNQDTGTSINTSTNAGAWPADMMNSNKVYGLTNPSIVPVW